MPSRKRYPEASKTDNNSDYLGNFAFNLLVVVKAVDFGPVYEGKSIWVIRSRSRDETQQITSQYTTKYKKTLFYGFFDALWRLLSHIYIEVLMQTESGA